MKARLRLSSLVLGALALVLPVFAPVPAVAQRTADDAQRILVTVFQSSDKQLGAKAANAVRDKLAKEYNPRDVWVIPTTDINNTLTASGYPTDDALGPSDARQLAVQVRADQYVDGTVAQTPTGYRIEARMVLSRDQTLAQVLPPAEASSLDRAAQQVVNSIKDARRQTTGELNCYRAFREGKYDQAVAAARKALESSPNGTLATICLGNAYGALKQQDSVQAIGERIIAKDPRNVSALRWLAEIYGIKNDPRRIPTLTALLAADPTNLKLQQQVVNELAQSGQAALAVPIIVDLVQANPGDPTILRTGWLVLLAAKDFERAINVGSELIRVDTTAADTSYYIRTAGAYTSLNRADSAAAILARGARRYPSNLTLQLFSAQSLVKAGRFSEGAAAARQIIALDPKNINAYVLLVQSQKQPDSVYAVLAALQNTPDSSARGVLGQLALQQAGTAINVAQQSKLREDFQRAVRFAQLSDKFSPSVDASYITGVAAYYIAEGAIQDAVKSKSCPLARMAQENFNLVQTTLPAAGRAHPDVAAQVLGAVQQYGPSVSQAVRQYCK